MSGPQPADHGHGAGPPDDVEIVVRHCDVRVVRRGGWSWGPDPAALPRRVVAALPGLLAERFAAHAAAGADVEVAEPVTLDVSVSLAELLAGDVDGAPASGRLDPPAPYAPAPVAAAPTSTVDGTGVRDAAARPWRAADPAAPARLFAALLDRGLLGRLGPQAMAAFAARGLDPAGGAVPPGAPAAVADGPAAAPAVAGPPAPAPRITGEVEVRSALPFLLAAALARLDLLDAVAGALARAGLLGDAPLFAAALAYKVLDPPRRGWLRSPQDRTAAAAFAGIAGADPDGGGLPDEALTGFAHRAGPALAPLDALIGLSVCAGHEPGRPLLVAEPAGPSGGGLMLVEPEGLFPVAWADEAAALLPYWEASGRPPVLVSGGTVAAGDPVLRPVSPPYTRALAAAGVPLVSAARPGRGERWHRLPPGAAAGTDPAATTAGLAELLGELSRRRAVPLAADPALERTLTLTASLALGTIAWLLWRHREPPDPQLALARLGDLGALVRFEAGAVRVRLPLGRRHTDLLAHGLLADVPDVVWLGGRTLTFSGG